MTTSNQFGLRSLLLIVFLVTTWLGILSWNRYPLLEWGNGDASLFGFFFWLWGGAFVVYCAIAYVLRRNFLVREVSMTLAIAAFVAAILNIDYAGLWVDFVHK